MTPSTQKSRIAWIDLAKGICITLVVLYHVTNKHPLAVQISSFRMPLYFILSGLFFKQYENFIGFLKRKTNKLLIPFVFFLMFTSVIPHDLVTHKSAILFLLKRGEVIFNLPIWFLLCLFEINIIFYVIQWLGGLISKKYQTPVVIALSLLAGIVGVSLGLSHVRLMLFVDTALSALPLFVFGWWLNRKTPFLRTPVNLKVDVPIIIACALIIWLAAAPFGWVYNNFSLTSVGPAYLCGVSGTIMILLISKVIKHLPLVSYWGRYSIIILCTHFPIKMLLMLVFKDVMPDVYVRLTVFLLTMVACHFMIPVMRKYFPYVTAQKDVIKVG